VRASDYIGAGAGSGFTLFVAPALLAGEEAVVFGDLDAVHSWTYTGDVARTLIAVAQDEASWGRGWHVPSTELSARELAGRFAAVAGAPEPRLRELSAIELHGAANADEIMRELPELGYLVSRPLTLDATRTREAFGFDATPIDTALRETADALAATAAA